MGDSRDLLHTPVPSFAPWNTAGTRHFAFVAIFAPFINSAFVVFKVDRDRSDERSKNICPKTFFAQILFNLLF
jgi:hypothetical protein